MPTTKLHPSLSNIQGENLILTRTLGSLSAGLGVSVEDITKENVDVNCPFCMHSLRSKRKFSSTTGGLTTTRNEDEDDGANGMKKASFSIFQDL